MTGGSRGIGRAIVERLASDGASVVVGYRSGEAEAAAVVADVVAIGGVAHAVRADVSDVGEIRELFARAEELLGGLDIVVLNAGIADGGLIADQSEVGYDAIMNVNAKGTFFGLQEAARRVTDGGRIVTISSVNSAIPEPGAAVYSASKAAIEQFSVIASKELGSRRISVNVVSPGATDTEMLRTVNTAEDLESYANLSPFGRLGDPSEVAAVVAFLVGPDGGWVTGQNVRASGGIP